MSGDEALAAWESWKKQVDLEKIDTGSARLLPLAYFNLRDRAPDDSVMKLARGAYRKAWFRNQILFRLSSQAVARLQEAGIRCMLFKGSAMAIRYYASPAHRPMDDLDLVVPFEDAERAIRILQSSGWPLIEHPLQSGPIEERILHSHGLSFRSQPEIEIDLHWHMISLNRVPNGNDGIWKRAEKATFCGLEVFVPSPTDSVMIACFHGSKQAVSGELSTLRWCADVIEIARQCEIDWKVLVEESAVQRVSPAVASALRYLVEAFGVQVPSWVLESLDAAKPSFLDRHFLNYMMDREHFSTDDVIARLREMNVPEDAIGYALGRAKQLVAAYAIVEPEVYRRMVYWCAEHITSRFPDGRATPLAFTRELIRWRRFQSKYEGMTWSTAVPYFVFAFPFIAWKEAGRHR